MPHKHSNVLHKNIKRASTQILRYPSFTQFSGLLFKYQFEGEWHESMAKATVKFTLKFNPKTESTLPHYHITGVPRV